MPSIALYSGGKNKTIKFLYILYNMKKRGQLVYKALLVIIASVIIISAFIQAGKSYGSQTAFFKLAVARDLALTIDLVYGLPGNIQYVYPNDISGYDADIIGNTVTVYDHKIGRQDPTSASHSFAGLETDIINAQVKGAKFVRIEKTDNKIIITGVD